MSVYVVHHQHPAERCPAANFTARAGLLHHLSLPSARFYIGTHFGIPDLDPGSWRLHVDGLVKRRLSLDLAQLRAMPPASAVVTLECAGNGRGSLEPPVPGEQWGLGAASTAEWT